MSMEGMIVAKVLMSSSPGVSRMTTVSEVPTKSKSGLCSRDEVLVPSDTRSNRHPVLPHSPSNKPPQSREVQFNKVVTGLLGLSGPIKTQHVASTNQSLPSGPKQCGP
jgi:hypothetical protein